mmetsp:Transcript_51944/g.62458  ORF Transcript_51944/g.62458 Transcript_51944/m.62458 type:complete len:233 (+) Transcript_51944:92-790(+)|eukprot:CAMPEP_0172502580 /NCGR_PEP_ID=MMETSP1066-20121228/161167_1 /TAXON_ID=671091 /ORGANISM="Coscinodiscus wailesii, Strain CCMP2513" /LENGTH=232 /DNA_ID=CAMNT_0013277883 /DNA_START=83 /DNA_END=781 /DNA_ORIENTATION=+
MKLISFAYLVAFVSAAEEDHVHGEETCACAAKHDNFVIDCNNTKAMTDALAILVDNSCTTDCSSDICHGNFKMIQAHHDFCLHHEVPEVVENSFHDYNDVCEHCSISRKRDPELVDCPKAVCDKRGMDAFAALVSSGCDKNCDTSTCASNYHILRSEHDNCPEETLTEDSQTGLHTYEDICAAQNCNSLLTDEAVKSQLVCTPVDAEIVETSAAMTASKITASLVVIFGFGL